MMDKTIKINLAGVLFQIDEQAYYMLRDYLQAINTRFRNVAGGNETVDDIESRIAEIFQSQQGLTGVVSKENVEAMISIIGKPEDFDLTENTPEVPGFSSKRRRLYFSGAGTGNQVNQNVKSVGGAFNEIFKALGKFFFIFFRIVMIIIGVGFVLTGFLALLTFIMVFIFKYPGSFSTDAFGMNLSYLPDFLNYIVTPSLLPWITTLILIVVALPLLALIYGGVKMIFWFRARDGIFLLSGLVLWVLGAAALSIILFNEGVSFAETAKSTSQNYFKEAPDTLYIISGRKISDLRIDKEISLPDEDYDVFISDEKKEIYIRTNLKITSDEDNSARVNVRKRSAGRSRLDAMEKAERLQYNFIISGDTLFLDEFFTIPAKTKWSFDYVGITVYAPEGTIIYMDKTSEHLFHSFDDEDFVTDPKNRFWKLTEEGLSYIEPHHKPNQ